MTEKQSSHDQSTKDHVIIIESPLIASEEHNDNDQRQSKNKTMFGLCSWIFIIGGIVVTGGVIVLIWYFHKPSPHSKGPVKEEKPLTPRRNDAPIAEVVDNHPKSKRPKPRTEEEPRPIADGVSVNPDDPFQYFKAKNIEHGWTNGVESNPWKGEVEVIIEPSGSTTYAYNNYVTDKTKKIGVMVAGNSGRPGGACGGIGKVFSIKPSHTTQEEDIFSNWMITECGDNQECWNGIYRDTIYQKWGMKQPGGSDNDTIQETDYTSPNLGAWRYGDSWVVKNQKLSVKEVDSVDRTKNWFDKSKNFPCDLFFVAGPNANSKKPKSDDPTSSMKRTYCEKAANNWEFFRDALKAALRGGMESMRQNGIEYAYVASVSTSLYAGQWRNRINLKPDDGMSKFDEILTEVCNEIVDDTGEPRCAGFKKVIRVILKEYHFDPSYPA